METSTRQGNDSHASLRRIGKIVTAGLFAALICSLTTGAAWARHHDDEHFHHFENHAWHHYHEGPAIVFGEPNYYYTPPPDYYEAPEPYGYYGPPAYGPEYYAPPSEGLNLFFHLR